MSDTVGYCVVYRNRIPACEPIGDLWVWLVLALLIVLVSVALGFFLGARYEIRRITSNQR